MTPCRSHQAVYNEGSGKTDRNRTYYLVDIELDLRQIISWGTKTRDQVEVELGDSCHRVFLSQGQFNKLDRKLRDE